MRRIGLRWSVRRVATILVLLSTLVVGVALLRSKTTNEEWRQRSSAFVEQVNSLGTTLEAGGVGFVHIDECIADQITLMPPYLRKRDIIERFPSRSPAFHDELFSISCDDRISPAIVWLRNGRILSVNPARFTVGVNFALQSWNLKGRSEIRVTKELESPNTFLSVSFLEHDNGQSITPLQ
jgi:hypothetical protein